MDANSIPGYTIKKKLGAGAMAAVFLAREKKLDRNVALKVMSARLLSDPTFAERFLREARIVASISHRNIVTVFDVGSHNGYHYMAMELLPGGDLTSKLKKGLPLKEAISHVMDIAEGLHYAASKKFIHRDIKPDNIMFAEDGRAVITDFGIARNTAAETSMTMVGSIIGTPQYMSPEQASAEKLDHRTDLYSLGIIVYQILTGSPPFKGDSAISTGVMHITQPVPLLPPRFERFQDFIDIALAKHPDDRFQSGHEFIEALAEIDLNDYDDFEAGTELITPEDLAKALGNSGANSGLHTHFNPGFNSDLNSDLHMAGAGVFGNQSYEQRQEKKKRSLVLPILLSSLLLVISGVIGAHVVYVNVLGKKINFQGLATGLSSSSEKLLGVKLNLGGSVTSLANTSKSFADFSGSIFGILPKTDDVTGLTAAEQSLVDSMNSAMRDGRLFSPPFDCAELYFLELKQINPESEIVQKKAKELFSLALESALELLTANEVDKAEQLITEAQRMLPYVKDEALHLKHQQISSSIIIARSL